MGQYSASVKAAELPLSVIAPAQNRLAALNLLDVWDYRELIYFLVWRDLKVRYRQTVLGASWAIIQPLFSMAIFTVIFGRVAAIQTDGVPYPLFAYLALLPWTYVANALTQASNSLVGNQALISKVYFPRLVIPLSAALSGLVDFLIAATLVVPMLVYFDYVPGVRLLALPFFVLLSVAAAFSVGVWLSALNVEYRDVKYVLPLLLQFWLFATPVAYPVSLVPEPYQPLYALNPMAGVVEGFRWCVLTYARFPIEFVMPAIIVVALLLVTGLFYFRRMERTFADII